MVFMLSFTGLAASKWTFHDHSCYVETILKIIRSSQRQANPGRAVNQSVSVKPTVVLDQAEKSRSLHMSKSQMRLRDCWMANVRLRAVNVGVILLVAS